MKTPKMRLLYQPVKLLDNKSHKTAWYVTNSVTSHTK